ncbi:MAG: phosphoribosylamine--glycine ligase [Deltaproteobacteria bacterium RIFCSPHIGHO2_02_FULL_40_11]|nr:MAG: phosphoribosylamine--glycine ligase [Deltaproteobacteria bacterium RIFCSPHIGHO2_02_FULL_40_11]
MKVLVLGSGGREHALCWKIAQSKKGVQVFCAPGNGGTAQIATSIDLDILNPKQVIQFVKENKIDWTIVGPEAPLASGIVDAFEAENLKIFGPNRKASQLEASKVFSKKLLQKYKISTASAQFFTDPQLAKAYLKTKNIYPIVMKADGLAQGKGVHICQSKQEAFQALEDFMVIKKFGDAGSEIVIEDFLDGEEVSFLGFTDGHTFLPMPAAQDHKRAFDNDQGENTGGMGAYAPVPWFDLVWQEKIQSQITKPLLEAFKKEDIHYRGILYIGLLISKNIPYVLEFNVRFGDPEAQVLLLKLKTDFMDIVEWTHAGHLSDLKIDWDPSPTVGVVMASGGYPGRYEKGFEIFGLETIEAKKDVIVFQAGSMLKGDKLVTHGGRVLCVTAKAKTYEEAIQKAYQTVQKIKFQNMQYRSDIGYRLWQNKK